MALFAEAIAPYKPTKQDLHEAQLPPSWEHPMGTDHLGRDVLSRLIHGTRISLIVGILSVGLAGAVGTFLGIVSVFVPRLWSEVIMRLVDTFLALPGVLIALSVAATVGPSLMNAILIIALVYWARFGRIVRGEALAVRELDFITGAYAMGASTMRLVFVHMLPNVMNTIVVISTLDVASAILLESILSFLGVGVPPPTPSWGIMVAEGRPYIAISWWIVTFPGLAIMITVYSVNLFGDWLRDILDPKLRHWS
jgi:peptide/nickel transport system permease protein